MLKHDAYTAMGATRIRGVENGKILGHILMMYFWWHNLYEVA